jgi:hypothetical protein
MACALMACALMACAYGEKIDAHQTKCDYTVILLFVQKIDLNNILQVLFKLSNDKNSSNS